MGSKKENMSESESVALWSSCSINVVSKSLSSTLACSNCMFPACWPENSPRHTKPKRKGHAGCAFLTIPRGKPMLCMAPWLGLRAPSLGSGVSRVQHNHLQVNWSEAGDFNSSWLQGRNTLRAEVHVANAWVSYSGFWLTITEQLGCCYWAISWSQRKPPSLIQIFKCCICRVEPGLLLFHFTTLSYHQESHISWPQSDLRPRFALSWEIFLLGMWKYFYCIAFCMAGEQVPITSTHKGTCIALLPSLCSSLGLQVMVYNLLRISVSLLLSVSADHITLHRALNAMAPSSLWALSFGVSNQRTFTISFLLTFIR